MPTGYIFLGAGIWYLYHAWRGIVPASGSTPKDDVGKPMRISTRLIFGIGGVLLTGVGVVGKVVQLLLNATVSRAE